MMIGLKKFLELPISFKPIKLKMVKGSLVVSRGFIAYCLISFTYRLNRFVLTI